jgi:hypothetical protein
MNYDAGEQDAEIRYTRMKMDLYMALYGWPRLLVAMMNSKLFKTMGTNNVFNDENTDVQSHVEIYFTGLKTHSNSRLCDNVLGAAREPIDKFNKDTWKECVNAILSANPGETLKKLSQTHLAFWKTALQDKVLGKDVKVMQHWNMNSNGTGTGTARYSFEHFFFPNSEEMAKFEKNGTSWMDTQCGEVTPDSYRENQKATLEPFRSIERNNKQHNFEQESQFLALFDFHLYRSLLCSNEVGKSLDEIFAKTSLEQKKEALNKLVKGATPDLVFTQEYHDVYNETLEANHYNRPVKEKGAVVHWNSKTLVCKDVSQDIASDFENGKLTLKLEEAKAQEEVDTALKKKFEEKLNFVKCQQKRDNAHTEVDTEHGEVFLAVSFHGASNLKNEEVFGEIGKDQLRLLHEILESVEREGVYSSIIVGADANQKLDDSKTYDNEYWASSSLGAWTKTHGKSAEKYLTVNKTRSFMQHQYAKAGEEDKKGKDHVLVYNSKNVQMTMKSAEIVYGFA